MPIPLLVLKPAKKLRHQKKYCENFHTAIGDLSGEATESQIMGIGQL